MKPKAVSARESYIDQTCVDETDLMKKIAKELKKDQKEIQLSPHEGKILSLLASLSQPQNVVEIGTLYGYSLNWILEGVDSSTKVWTVEKSEENFKKAISFLDIHNKKSQVQVVNQSGLEFLENWPSNKKIDFLFIDADKGNYLNYLNLAKPYLSKGAIVVGDNTFLFGHVLKSRPPENYSKNTWSTMREFNEILSGRDGDFEGVIFPTFQGLTVGQKKN